MWVVRVPRTRHTVGRFVASAAGAGPAPAASLPVPVRARTMWGATAGPRPSSGASAAAVAPLSARPSGYRPHRHWHAHGWR